MEKHIIIGVHVTDRIHHVSQVQQVLTESGCNIKTRIGLHEASESTCSPNGLILLEMVGDDKPVADVFEKLNAIEGVEAKRMVFGH